MQRVESYESTFKDSRRMSLRSVACGPAKLTSSNVLTETTYGWESKKLAETGKKLNLSLISGIQPNQQQFI